METIIALEISPQNEALLSNRAAAFIQMKMYKEGSEDCKLALAFND
jgi:hypothetical protein